MVEKLKSRKLWMTVLSVALVACADMFGMPLDSETLAFVQNTVMTLIGGQSLVDTSKAYTAGSQVADEMRSLKKLVVSLQLAADAEVETETVDTEDGGDE